MKLDQTFTVQAEADVVWRALTDVERVAPNLPGAAITEDAGEGVFKGEFKVKIGPTTAAYNGALKMEHLDEDARVATMSARGTDKRGNGGASATIVSRVSPDPDGGGTRVDVETDFSITGKLARFGRGGMIQDVSNRLLREFAANLQEDLGGSSAAVVETVVAAPDASRTTTSAPAGPADGAEPTQAFRAPREPSEPVGGIALVAGVLATRVKAVAAPLLGGLVLGVLASRRWELRRR